MPGVSTFRTPKKSLLPRRHQPHRAEGRRRAPGGLESTGTSGPPVHPHLRGADADGPGRARHHHDLCLQRGRWLATSARRAGSACGSTDVLDRAGVGRAADQSVSTAVDGFTISTPLRPSLDGRDALVAIGMNGSRAAREHGFPARLITPGLYGFVGATKWLTTPHPDDVCRPAGLLDQAHVGDRRPDQDLRPHRHPRAAVDDQGRADRHRRAWPGPSTAGVGKVEVKIDGGAWQPALLGPDAGIDYWRQWYLPWDATSAAAHGRRPCRRPRR